MMKILAATALLLASTSAALADVPGAGQFGFGVNLTGTPLVFSRPPGGFAGADSAVSASVQGLYWATDRLQIDLRVGLLAGNWSGTTLQPLLGANYFFVKDTARSYGLFADALLGANFAWPQNDQAHREFLAQGGVGGEYFVSRSFSVQLFEGFQYSARTPRWFGLVSQIGARIYF